jgi:hypothetical protein
VLCCVAETPESEKVRTTSPKDSMSEPPKPESRRVKIIQHLDHVSKESVVRTSTVESRISGHDKKVGVWFCNVSVTKSECDYIKK